MMVNKVMSNKDSRGYLIVGSNGNGPDGAVEIGLAFVIVMMENR